eukprot:gene6-biopygen19538
MLLLPTRVQYRCVANCTHTQGCKITPAGEGGDFAPHHIARGPYAPGPGPQASTFGPISLFQPRPYAPGPGPQAKPFRPHGCRYAPGPGPQAKPHGCRRGPSGVG